MTSYEVVRGSETIRKKERGGKVRRQAIEGKGKDVKKWRRKKDKTIYKKKKE